MWVRHLALVDFRNYATADVRLEKGPNLFVGRNGQGKTNLVEAVGYLSTLGSHRVSNDQALIRQGADAAIIRARLAHVGRELLTEVQINRAGANRAQVNRNAVRVRELPRYFSSVLFAPEDLALIKGEPAGRRRFLDQLLVLRTPRMAGVLADYERVLKQRNTLLKTVRSSGLKDRKLPTLDIWDERLIEFGAEIIAERLSLTNALREPMRQAYESVAGADHGPQLNDYLTITAEDPANVESGQPAAGNQPDSPVGDAFRVALSKARRNEMERGLTLVGPHRDDVIFELNGLPAKGYASHGESWSLALALKLASAELLRQESQAGDPVLILDDVFAELDQTRRRRLAGSIADYEQVLITAAVLQDIPTELTAHTVHIEAGVIMDDREPEEGEENA